MAVQASGFTAAEKISEDKGKGKMREKDESDDKEEEKGKSNGKPDVDGQERKTIASTECKWFCDICGGLYASIQSLKEHQTRKGRKRCDPVPPDPESPHEYKGVKRSSGDEGGEVEKSAKDGMDDGVMEMDSTE